MSSRARVAVAVGAVLLAGCYVPLLDEAGHRAMHERMRQDPRSQSVVAQRIATASCFQLREWERAVHEAAATGDARGPFAKLAPDILRSDATRLQDAAETRRCPTYAELLASRAPEASRDALRFRCACWIPRSYFPIGSFGDGGAGKDCITVRIEVTAGELAFFERAPNFGERRHVLSAQTRVYGALDFETRLKLIVGGYDDAGWSDTETDGWLDTPLGGLRLLADDCRALPPAQAEAAEKAVLRLLTSPEP